MGSSESWQSSPKIAKDISKKNQAPRPPQKKCHFQIVNVVSFWYVRKRFCFTKFIFNPVCALGSSGKSMAKGRMKSSPSIFKPWTIRGYKQHDWSFFSHKIKNTMVSWCCFPTKPEQSQGMIGTGHTTQTLIPCVWSLLNVWAYFYYK